MKKLPSAEIKQGFGLGVTRDIIKKQLSLGALSPEKKTTMRALVRIDLPVVFVCLCTCVASITKRHDESGAISKAVFHVNGECCN